VILNKPDVAFQFRILALEIRNEIDAYKCYARFLRLTDRTQKDHRHFKRLKYVTETREYNSCYKPMRFEEKRHKNFKRNFGAFEIETFVKATKSRTKCYKFFRVSLRFQKKLILIHS
jgi:hypothetical protein